MCPHVIKYQLLMLKTAEAHLPDISGLVAIGLINASRHRICASPGSPEGLSQPSLHQGLQRSLGLGRLTLDVYGQLIGR